jgi:hypothetical protein
VRLTRVVSCFWFGLVMEMGGCENVAEWEAGRVRYWVSTLVIVGDRRMIRGQPRSGGVFFVPSFYSVGIYGYPVCGLLLVFMFPVLCQEEDRKQVIEPYEVNPKEPRISLRSGIMMTTR